MARESGCAGGSLQKVSNDWAESECWHQERDTFSSDRGQCRMEVEFEERFRSVERGMWECRIGVEGVRSVPLEERMVTSTGKELRMMSVSTFLDMVALWFPARVWVWVAIGFVPYLELVIELLPVQVPSARIIDSKIPGITTLMANSRHI